jgi:xanthine dehydrogenase iron-sulfur cluster and FAD-binding subunit A
MIGDGDCGAIGVMKIGRGNRSSQRKPSAIHNCVGFVNVLEAEFFKLYRLHPVVYKILDY